MQILADRFLVHDDGGVIDLATRQRVTLRVEAGGGAAEQARWAVRCQTLHGLHHPAMAVLLDFGALGESQRFEAWQGGSMDRVDLEATDKAVGRVRRFLRACKLTDGAEALTAVSVRRRGVVVVPDSSTGYPAQAGEQAIPSSPMALQDCGMLRINRPAVTAIADMFSSFSGFRPRVVALWGPSGSGRTTGILDIARMARLKGFVPIDCDIAEQLAPSLIRNRSLCLIDDGAKRNRWSVLVAVASRTPRPHAVIVVGENEARSFDGAGLESVSAERLVSAVWPPPSSDALARQAARAATTARGLPGRFASLLWGNPQARRPVTAAVSRVAERQPVYGAEEPESIRLRRCAVQTQWPAPGEIARLEQRAEAACVLIKRGRHTPGVRQLRQAIGGLARRGDWTRAGAGALALASALLARGSVADAEHAVEHAARYAGRAGDEVAALDAAILRAHVAIDCARLDEAETMASVSLVAARRLDCPSRVAAASLALGRCLFWRGRYGDADAAVSPWVGEASASGVRLPAMALAARIAVGAGDLVRAMGLVGVVCELAAHAGTVDADGLASYTAGVVHLAVNDLDAADRDIRACLIAARAGRNPLRAVRARVLLAECARRRGTGRLTAPSLRYLRRIARYVPAVLRERVGLMLAVGTTPTAAAELAQSHAARSGLAALTLYVSARHQPQSPGSLSPVAMDEFVAIIQTCQEAEDDTALLSHLCARVQGQLQAGSVAFFIREAGTCALIASSGGRLDSGGCPARHGRSRGDSAPSARRPARGRRTCSLRRTDVRGRCRALAARHGRRRDARRQYPGDGGGRGGAGPVSPCGAAVRSARDGDWRHHRRERSHRRASPQYRAGRVRALRCACRG